MPLVFTYKLVVQAVPSDFQRVLSDGLRQDCSKSMALGVRRGEITLAVRSASGHCDRIWRRDGKRRHQWSRSEGDRKCSRAPIPISAISACPPKDQVSLTLLSAYQVCWGICLKGYPVKGQVPWLPLPCYSPSLCSFLFALGFSLSPLPPCLPSTHKFQGLEEEAHELRGSCFL